MGITDPMVPPHKSGPGKKRGGDSAKTFGNGGGKGGGNVSGGGGGSAALLPAGLTDRMPGLAAHEAHAITVMMAAFTRLGYAHVSPPLVEFEETLLAGGPGAVLAADTFRLMDPLSSRQMALRADMTAQIARIATARLGHLPRPLRLSYHGEVLRVRADALNPERQLTQIGAEMIGAASAQHDAEVAIAALMALTDLGIGGLTIDLGIPRLPDTVLGHAPASPALAEAVRAKDHAAVKKHGGAHADLLTSLLDVALGGGDGKGRIPHDKNLPAPVAAMLTHLDSVAGLIQSAMGDGVAVTIDPLEARGFDYHHGIGFAVFAPGVRGELGRGGRYRTALAAAADDDTAGEESCGVTLYLERVLTATSPPPAPARLYIPAKDGLAVLAQHARAGHAVILGSNEGDTAALLAEARALGCTHILQDGKRAALDS